jgi:hypothetical protein
MNALAEKTQRRVQDRAPGRNWRRPAILGLLTLAGPFSACADIGRATSLPPVNPESPVAGVVAAAAHESYKRPTFQSVPPTPLNIPPPAAVKTAVIDMVRCRRAYEGWAATHPALVAGTAGFAEDLRAKLDTAPADVPSPEEKAASEAQAAKMRAYAEPPPAMHPGPAPNPADATPPASIAAASPQGQRRAPPAARIAAAAPPPAAPVRAAAAPSGAAIGQTSVTPTVAVFQPSMAPVYGDPLLARCQ